MGDVKRQDGDGGVDRMFDSEWLAVVSHDNRYFGYSTEDAVEKAVKMTEERMARHLRERTATLARERDQAMAAYADMVREIESSQAELTRLRAVEVEYAALRDLMKDRMPQLIAAGLAIHDGYDPEDQHGGLYDLRWSGGPTPEPEGDAWNMDYMPRGEIIAAVVIAALAEVCGRKG